MRLKLTTFEKSWLRIFGVLGAAVVAVLLILPVLPANRHKNEPLADAATLQKLIAGIPLPTPIQETAAVFHGTSATPPVLASITNLQRVLGTNTDGEKRIEVDLTRQRVLAFEGNRKVFEFPVSTGKWGATPTGEFRIWVKVRSQLMSGGNKNDNTYYYLPNVPYVMFFYNSQVDKSRGFSLHGTYWHNNFGHPMSHGCVNMRTEDVALLYQWADPPVVDAKAWSVHAAADNPGTKIIIYGVTPTE